MEKNEKKRKKKEKKYESHTTQNRTEVSVFRWSLCHCVPHVAARAETRTEQNTRNTSKSAAQQRARNDANDDGLFATKRQHFPIVVHALEEQSTMREYDDDDPSFGKTSVRCSTEFFSMSTTRATKDKNVEQRRQKQRKQRKEETRCAFCDCVCGGRVR